MRKNKPLCDLFRSQVVDLKQPKSKSEKTTNNSFLFLFPTSLLQADAETDSLPWDLSFKL